MCGPRDSPKPIPAAEARQGPTCNGILPHAESVLPAGVGRSVRGKSQALVATG